MGFSSRAPAGSLWYARAVSPFPRNAPNDEKETVVSPPACAGTLLGSSHRHLLPHLLHLRPSLSHDVMATSQDRAGMLGLGPNPGMRVGAQNRLGGRAGRRRDGPAETALNPHAGLARVKQERFPLTLKPTPGTRAEPAMSSFDSPVSEQEST